MISSRAKLLGKFVSIQLIVQILGMLSGILVVRALSKTEYAFFTITNSMQATMNVLADSGIGIGLSSIGGKVWQDPCRFGQLVRTAMRLRRFFACLISTIITPILIYILLLNSAPLIYILPILAATLLELHFYLTNGVLSIVPRLHSRIRQIQGAEIIFCSSRLILLLVTNFVYINVVIVTFISTFSSGLQSFFIRKWIADDINIEAPINKEDQSELLRIASKQIPYFLFYCIQGQLTIFLISVFGETSSVAEFGALGRLSILLSVISSVMSTIIVPGYARCQSKEVLRRRYYQIIFLFLFLAFIFVSLTTIFSKEFLWILGEQYSNLKKEATLIAINAMIYSFSGILWSINSAKAWVDDSWLIIPSTIATQIFLLFIIDISSVEGVIKFGIFSIIPTSLINLHMGLKGIKEIK